MQITLNKADAGYTSDLYLVGATGDDLLISDTTHNVGAIARRYHDNTALRFFIKVHPTSGSPYDVYSDSIWARTTTGSANAQSIAFEDIPDYWKSDKDYNDVIIAVEKVNCDGDVGPIAGDPTVTPPPSEPPAPPPPPEDPGITPPDPGAPPDPGLPPDAGLPPDPGTPPDPGLPPDPGIPPSTIVEPPAPPAPPAGVIVIRREASPKCMPTSWKPLSNWETSTWPVIRRNS